MPLWLAIELCVFCLVIGISAGVYHQKTKPRRIHDLDIDGDLIIDTKNPHKDTFRFELYYSPEKILEETFDKEYVRFRILKQ